MLSDGSAHRPRWAHPQIRHKHTDCTPKCPQTEAALIFVPGFIESELAAAAPVTLAFLPFLFSFWTCKRTQRGHQGRRKRRCRGAAGAPSSHCWAGLPGSAPRPSWSFLPLVRVCTATEQRPELHTSRPSYAVKGLLGRPRAGPQGSPWGPYALGPVTWVVRGHSGPGRGEGGGGPSVRPAGQCRLFPLGRLWCSGGQESENWEREAGPRLRPLPPFQRKRLVWGREAHTEVRHSPVGMSPQDHQNQTALPLHAPQCSYAPKIHPSAENGAQEDQQLRQLGPRRESWHLC